MHFITRQQVNVQCFSLLITGCFDIFMFSAAVFLKISLISEALFLLRYQESCIVDNIKVCSNDTGTGRFKRICLQPAFPETPPSETSCQQTWSEGNPEPPVACGGHALHREWHVPGHPVQPARLPLQNDHRDAHREHGWKICSPPRPVSWRHNRSSSLRRALRSSISVKCWKPQDTTTTARSASTLV